ncbi:MAG: Carotenoid biosynthesis protein, partial [uncultured Gemmatimonadaceae bacterium]
VDIRFSADLPERRRRPLRPALGGRVPARTRRALVLLGLRLLHLPHRHAAGVAADAHQPGGDARRVDGGAGEHRGARRAGGPAARHRQDRRAAGTRDLRRRVRDHAGRRAHGDAHGLPVRAVLLHPAARLPGARPRAVQHPDVVVLHAVLRDRHLRAAARRARRRARQVEVGARGGARAHRVGRLDGPGDGEHHALALAPRAARPADRAPAHLRERHLLRHAALELARVDPHRHGGGARDARDRAAERVREPGEPEQLPARPVRGERRAPDRDLRAARAGVGRGAGDAGDGGAARDGAGQGRETSDERRAGSAPFVPRRGRRRL